MTLEFLALELAERTHWLVIMNDGKTFVVVVLLVVVSRFGGTLEARLWPLALLPLAPLLAFLSRLA